MGQVNRRSDRVHVGSESMTRPVRFSSDGCWWLAAAWASFPLRRDSSSGGSPECLVEVVGFL